MGERLGFPSQPGNDETPPPVEVRLDGASTDELDAQNLPAPTVESRSAGKTGRLGSLRNMLGVALIAAASGSCSAESDTSAAEQGGGTPETIETASQRPRAELQLMEGETPEDGKFFLSLWSLNKPVRFQIINKSIPGEMAEVISSGEKYEELEGSIKFSYPQVTKIMAFDAETGENIPVGNPAPEGGIELGW